MSLSTIIGIALMYEVFKTNRLIAAIAHEIASRAEEDDVEGDWSDEEGLQHNRQVHITIKDN